MAGLLLAYLAWWLAVVPPGGGLGAAPDLAQSSVTPASLPTVPARAAATPTARVVASAPATPSPSPTATDAPPATRAPTAVPLPTETPVPAPPPVARAGFAAEDWTGGYYRGDGRWYGRSWVAVYGSASPYPRAALAVDLDATPSGPAGLTITGLDDEWAARNEVAVEVNGERIYAGPSPWPDWDGAGRGANAAWTEASFVIPDGLLRAGRNEIAVANLTPSANFGLPPYVLLSDATLDVPGG